MTCNIENVSRLWRCFFHIRSGRHCYFFFFQAEDGIRDLTVTGVQTCALPISGGKAYTANFGGGTISVIDTSTNSVAATLPARVFPEDVTVSTTARPRILNYSFQAFDPQGSVDTVPRAVNNLGQNVGSFIDGTEERQANGSFVTIDPPGSTFTI